MESLAELGEISKGLFRSKKVPGMSASRQRVAAIQAKEAEKRAAAAAHQEHLARAHASANPPASNTPSLPDTHPAPPGTPANGINRRTLEWTSPGRLLAIGGGTAAAGAGGTYAYKKRRQPREQ